MSGRSARGGGSSLFAKPAAIIFSVLMVLLAVAPVIAQNASVGTSTAQDSDAAQRREDWFLRPRAYPMGKIPAGAREAALNEAAAMGGKSVDDSSGLVWRPVGAAASAGSSITPYFNGLAIHPSSDRVSIGGAVGRAAVVYNDGTWIGTGAPRCDGGFAAIDATFPNTVFATCGDLRQGAAFVFRSLSGGFAGDYVAVEKGIDGSDPASYFPPLVGDASRGQTFYLATNRVYQTLDGGDNWRAISADLSGSAGNYLTALAIAPSDSNFVYVGSIDGVVQVSRNALGRAVEFTRVTAGLPNRAVSSIAIDGGNALRAYVAVSGYSGSDGDTRGHVFATASGGAEWSDISGNLPNIPVNAIVADADRAGALYVATDIGVFFTSDSGASWQPLGTGLPKSEVMALSLRRASRVLTATTHERGAWQLALGGLADFVLSEISPVRAGPAPVLLRATGKGFTGESVIRVSGAPITPTTLNGDGSLSAAIPAALLRGGGVFGITVANGAKVTNSLPLATANPVPTISSITPTSGIVGDGTVLITVSGSNFLSSSVINFGNTSLTPGTSASSTSMTATIPLSALATAAEVNVTVTNPAPGGGTSNAVTFDVQDYAFGTVSPAVATIKAGTTANFTIPVVALFGFDVELTLSCGTGIPGGATCTFNPTDITPSASGANEMLAIATRPNSMAPPLGGGRRPQWLPIAGLGLIGILVVWLALRMRTAPRSRGIWGLAATRVALAMALAALMFGVGLAGCGGGGSGTPVGTYQVTITASGNANGTDTATHMTTVTLIVQ